MTIWWSLVLFLGGMLTGAGVDMLLVRYVVPPRTAPVEPDQTEGGGIGEYTYDTTPRVWKRRREPHRIEGTDIVLEPDPAHHANHCA